MLTFEALAQTPKAAALAAGNDSVDERGGISFEEFLKGVSKHSVLLAQNGSAILASKEKSKSSQGADDPKAMLLALLHNGTDTKNKELPELLKNENVKSLQSEQEDLLALLKNDQSETFTLNPALSKELSVNELKYLLHKAKQYLKTKILQADPGLTPKKLPKSLKGLLQLADKLKIEITKLSFETITVPDAISRHEKASHKKSVSITTEIATSSNKRAKLKTIETKLEQIKQTPLFQPKNKTVDIKHIMTTAQIIENKSKKEQTKKTETNDLLHSLLKKQNKKREKASKPLFANPTQFSTKAMPTLSPTQENRNHKAHTDIKNLEELLHTENTIHETKPHIHKAAENLDVKIHEAKQMMKYLSQDIKKAIDEYKPPFSRVKVTLNPQRLGEMDLTVVQRGKNVHINLSSNNAALNILTNNLNELRTQLSQNGINNATFNFNSDAHDQQHRQKEQQAHRQYEYFAGEEENEEQSRSLEIIIPRYI